MAELIERIRQKLPGAKKAERGTVPQYTDPILDAYFDEKSNEIDGLIRQFRNGELEERYKKLEQDALSLGFTEGQIENLTATYFEACTGHEEWLHGRTIFSNPEIMDTPESKRFWAIQAVYSARDRLTLGKNLTKRYTP